MKNETNLNLDKGTVPVGVVVAAFFRSWGAVIALLSMAFVFGAKQSALSAGQDALNAAVQEIKEDRKFRIRESDALAEANGERLASIETKVDLLLKRER